MDLALVELREELDESLTVYQTAADAIEEAPEDADLEKLQATFDEAEERYTNARKEHQKATERQDRARKRFELQERIKDARKLTEDGEPVKASVKKEPLTYRKHGPHSIFRDLLRVTVGTDSDAQERLSRHTREMEVERSEKFDLSSTDSAGGHLVPPLYLQEEFIRLARAGRVVVDALGPRSLPPNTDSINIPRMSTGTATADQADNAAVTETDAAFDTVAAAVKTIAGMQDVSQQLVDRSVPGVDEVIFSDLVRDYSVRLDTAVINSATTSNLGLLQVSGINAVTYTDASPTAGELYPKIADGVQQIHTGIFTPATHVFMHPRRWAFFLGAVDSSGRPLVAPYAPQNPEAEFGGVQAQGLVGNIQGLPVYVDANIPTNAGTNTREDRLLIVSAPDCYVWEDPSGPYLETFRDVGSGTLTVRFRLHNYWAQCHARRPKAISAVSGSGMDPPTF